MNNEDFIGFLNKLDKRFLMPASEISRSHTGNKDVLVDSNIAMYSLDDICAESRALKDNLPKTTDALWYKIENGKLTLYIIEFKFFNVDGDDSSYKFLNLLHDKLTQLNKPKDYYSDKAISDAFLKRYAEVKNALVDKVEVSLRLKPYETLMVALPLLYEEYGGNRREFVEYLQNIDIKLFVFVNRTAPYRNLSAERAYTHSINNALRHQYMRLKQAKLISYWDIRASHQFDDFLKGERLI